MRGVSHVALGALLAGERRVIARAISAAENEAPGAEALARALVPHLGRAHVVGITGAPGAGKSTLINAILGELLTRGLRIAVIAVDPSSPVSGGAVLGDRVRMGEHGAHERVFIRSVSARGHLGGVSRTTARVVDVFDAAGYDVVLVETVGAGQSEVEITALADTRVVVCPPGLGDEVQALKAGILEIADALVVSKGDLPDADRTAHDLRDMLRLRARGAPAVPIITTVGTRREGVRELVDFVLQHGSEGGRGRRFARRHAPTVDEIAAVDRALATIDGEVPLAATPVDDAVVEAILAVAGETPPGAHCQVRALSDRAPVVLLCADDVIGPSHALACGMWVQRVVSAARARGLDATTTPLTADASAWRSLYALSAEAHPLLAVALGYRDRAASAPGASAPITTAAT